MTSYECEKVHSAFVGELLLFTVDFRANIVLFLYDILLYKTEDRVFRAVQMVEIQILANDILALQFL